MTATKSSAMMVDDSLVAGDATAVGEANQYRFMKLSSVENNVVRVSGVTDTIIGVLDNVPAIIGAGARVAILGHALVKSDGSGTPILIGDEVGPDAAGRAIKKTVDDNVVAGISFNASSAVDILIGVWLVGPAHNFRTNV